MVWASFKSEKSILPEDMHFEQPRLVFVIGNFASRDSLRKALHYVPANHAPTDQYTPRWNWIEGTFAADMELKGYEHYRRDERNLVGAEFPHISRTNFPDDALYFFRFRNKVLLVTKEVQDGLRSEIKRLEELGKVFDEKYGPIPSAGGLIPYAHLISRQIIEQYCLSKGRPSYPDVFSIVVDEASVSCLENAVSAEFKEGADVFTAGFRNPDEYLDLIRALAGGSVNPRKYKGMVFNVERFRETRGLLVPKHDYGNSQSPFPSGTPQRTPYSTVSSIF